MSEGYPFGEIESKWRNRWETRGYYRTDLDRSEQKHYVLVMFSYPSDKKLHIGHCWNYSGTDTYARFKRMQGFNVFEPMGFDAFGLPAENYAVKHGVHPAITTRESISQIREQLKQIGAMYDWSREVDTSQPEYYKWTQWLFLQLFKKGAAYRKRAPVNWCPQCQTVLANEQVKTDGGCERCGSGVEPRDLEQWFFRITDYADQLLEGLNRVDWPESTKTKQRHWIGRSEGSEISFAIEGSTESIRCFTTRADTLFGVTYVVLAPEHELASRITTSDQLAQATTYTVQARQTSEIERLSLEREKSGCFTGSWAINPATGERIPIWIADYVLATYGTGAVMAVPAHDQRDFKFAAKYGLRAKWVIAPTNPQDTIHSDRAFEEYGVMHSSGSFDGLNSKEGIKDVTDWLKNQGLGRATVSFRLRDWLISRQRYWGAPIPIVHCPDCGLIPVPESELPLLLPQDAIDFTPRGASPLGSCESFINTVCPSCGKPARRDPDTMDTFVCSSWYYLRYVSTHRNDKPFDETFIKNWLPVDVYVGGPEHATGHLIYARYIAKFLNFLGEIPFDEPFSKLVHQGIITHNGQRMSKSKGNVVNPDSFISKFGSDCFRLYLMFMGDFTVGGDWSDEGIIGARRFQKRAWRLVETWAPALSSGNDTIIIDRDLNRSMNYAIKEVTNDLGRFQFNTAISRIMEFVNALYDYTSDTNKVNPGFLRTCLENMTLMLAPLAPHMCEEMWEILGYQDSVFNWKWPQWDESTLGMDTATVVIQINGKLIDKVEVPTGTSQEKMLDAAMKLIRVKRNMSERTLKRVIYVPDRILNLVF